MDNVLCESVYDVVYCIYDTTKVYDSIGSYKIVRNRGDLNISLDSKQEDNLEQWFPTGTH